MIHPLVIIIAISILFVISNTESEHYLADYDKIKFCACRPKKGVPQVQNQKELYLNY